MNKERIIELTNKLLNDCVDEKLFVDFNKIIKILSFKKGIEVGSSSICQNILYLVESMKKIED